MKITYCAVVDTQRKQVRVYGRKLHAIYDHVSYKAKQRPRFIEGRTANQMDQLVQPLIKQGYKVRSQPCAKGGHPYVPSK
jgi:hypothetical protein